MSNVTRWYNSFIKPKREDSLYNIAIKLESSCKIAVVRDCSYNIKNDQFTQIDDQTIFEQQEVIDWQRQYLPNNQSNDIEC
jgi:hypothetical protein